jgi:hypothetical protein
MDYYNPGIQDTVAMLCNSLWCLIITHLRWNIMISYMPINAVFYTLKSTDKKC